MSDLGKGINPWLIEKSSEINELVKANQLMISKFDAWIDKVIVTAINDNYPGIKIKRYKPAGHIHFYKKEWITGPGEWDMICIYLGLQFNSYVSEESTPHYGIYIGPSKTYPMGRKVIIADLYERIVKMFPNFMPSKDSEVIVFPAKVPSMVEIASKLREGKISEVENAFITQVKELKDIFNFTGEYIKTKKLIKG